MVRRVLDPAPLMDIRRAELAAIGRLGLQHVSMYELTLHKGTRLHSMHTCVHGIHLPQQRNVSLQAGPGGTWDPGCGRAVRHVRRRRGRGS